MARGHARPKCFALYLPSSIILHDGGARNGPINGSVEFKASPGE